MIRGRRARKRLQLLGAAVLLAVCLVSFFVYLGRRRQESNVPGTATSPGAIRLTFNLPCAVFSGDTERAYAAVRQRDKKTLMDMLAQRRLRMLRQGTAVTIFPLRGVAVVDVAGDTGGERTCYVPIDMIAVVEHNHAR